LSRGESDRMEVSILIAVFNGERYLRLAIDSVLGQDFRSIELVVVDDASTDRTAAIIRGYDDPRIVYLRNATNLGQTKSLNLALLRARGRYIARIDADDIFLPGKIGRQHEFMTTHPEVAVCGTWAVRIDEDGRPIGVNHFPTRPVDIRFRTLRTVPVCHVSIMARKSAIEAYGGYPETYRYAADYALWSAMLCDSRTFVNLPEVLVQYREFPQSLGARHTIGGAGEERGEIVERNARQLAGVELTREESRAIALLYSGSVHLDPPDLRVAYARLRVLAKVVYGRVPARVSVELMAALLWGLAKTHAEGRHQRTQTSTDHRPSGKRTDAVGPEVMILSVLAWLVSMLGFSFVSRLKNSLMPRLLRRLR
jgi:glycosyltransferase involved in cell wall biosynthesis